jgi:hypothetical protein
VGCNELVVLVHVVCDARSNSMQMLVSRRIMGLADASVEDDGTARASPGRSLERFLGSIQQVEERRAPRVSHGDEDDSIACADDLVLAARESKCLRDADGLAAAVHEDSRTVGCWPGSKTYERAQGTASRTFHDLRLRGLRIVSTRGGPCQRQP